MQEWRIACQTMEKSKKEQINCSIFGKKKKLLKGNVLNWLSLRNKYLRIFSETLDTENSIQDKKNTLKITIETFKEVKHEDIF